MRLRHLPIAADVSDEQLRSMCAGDLERLRNSAWKTAEEYEAAAGRFKQRGEKFGYELDAWQARRIAMKINAEVERRKGERPKTQKGSMPDRENQPSD
ncbi:hypothetical protein [Tistlia consotensis]|uniref:hypothetical protein n=1 Tax=Tistlia consotensis TaxID=1321365 RepID=UPI00117CD345|nr:hypothetical protein [Tistlia consotensis]